MPVRQPDTEQLLRAAGQGDAQARGQLLQRHRDRPKRMVAIRFDRRLAARVDSSDVVQETLVADSRPCHPHPIQNLNRFLRTPSTDRIITYAFGASQILNRLVTLDSRAENSHL